MRKPIKLPEGRDFKGIWLSAERYLDTNLSLIEIIILSEVESFQKRGECYASNQHFADFLGISENRIKHIIPDLVERGYLDSVSVFNQEKQKKERKLSISDRHLDQSAKNSTYPSATNDTTHSAKNSTKKNTYISNTDISITNNIDNNNGLDIYSNNSIKELRSDKPGLKDYEKPLMHSMEDAINGLTESGNFIRGIEINDSFVDKMMYVAKSYADRYYKEYDKPHPYINANDEFSPMQEVVLRFIDGDRSIADLSEKDIDTTIDLFFKNKKFMDSNHRISLFSMPDIWIRRVKEMERLEDKPNFYGIGLWQLPESEPDEWWKEDFDPNFWNIENKHAKIAL